MARRNRIVYAHNLTAAPPSAILATVQYKTTVRFSPEELLKLRKAAGDAPIPRYVRLAALRDADRKIAEEEARVGVLGTIVKHKAEP